MTVAVEGETDTVMSEVAPRMTAALAVAERSARDAAVTVITFDCGAVAGAVYKPVLEMCPQAIPLQVVPVTLQTTTLFVVPLTVALNCT
jgi:hypothetical protein